MAGPPPTRPLPPTPNSRARHHLLLLLMLLLMAPSLLTVSCKPAARLLRPLSMQNSSLLHQPERHLLSALNTSLLHPLDRHLLLTSNFSLLHPPDRHLLVTSNSSLLHPPDHHLLATSNSSSLLYRVDRRLLVTLNSSLLHPPDRHLLVTLNSSLLHPPDRHLLITLNSSLLHPPDRHLLVTLNSSLLHPPDRHLIVTLNSSLLHPPDRHLLVTSNSSLLRPPDRHLSNSSLLRPQDRHLGEEFGVDDTSVNAEHPPCVLWMAPFASGGGYSSEAWSYISSLDGNAAAGVGDNFTLSIAHHGDLESPEFWHGLPEQSRNMAHRLATAQCELPRAVVVCHNEPGSWYPPVQGSLSCPPTGYDEPAFVIGRTMFETDRVSPEHVKRCNQMDAVWVPTDFHVSTFEKSGVAASKVVKVVQAVDVAFFDPAKHVALPLPIGFSVVPDDSTRNPLSPEGKGFLFLSVFKWEQRKGWDVLLRAFLQEFSRADDVALYLLIHAYQSGSDFGGKIHRFVKSSRIDEPVGGWAQLRVIDEHIPQSSLPRLYKAADAFVLPSRGEGWGRPVVEAMAMELPVIVTNWSGPTEYLTEENGYPLDVERMSEVTDGTFKGHMCAEPSVDHLRALMRRVFVDREEARSKGRKAREDMVERFSPEVVARIVADQIQQVLTRT